MWGASFAELAKKAHEQANSLASHSPSLFNLDGLQGAGDVDQEEEHNVQANTDDEMDNDVNVEANLNMDMAAESETKDDFNAESAEEEVTETLDDEEVECGEEEEQYREQYKNEEITEERKSLQAPIETLAPTDSMLPVETPDAASTEVSETEGEESNENVDANQEQELNVSDTPNEQNGTGVDEDTKSTTDMADNEIKKETESVEKDEIKAEETAQLPDQETSDDSPIESAPSFASPSMKSMIKNTANIFNESSKHLWKIKDETSPGMDSSITSNENSESSNSEDDGLLAEERNLESVVVQLDMEVQDSENKDLGSPNGDETNVVDDSPVPNENVDDEYDDGENSGWTDVDVEAESDEDISPSNEEKVVEEKALITSGEEIDTSSPHSSEVLVEDPFETCPDTPENAEENVEIPGEILHESLDTDSPEHEEDIEENTPNEEEQSKAKNTSSAAEDAVPVQNDQLSSNEEENTELSSPAPVQEVPQYVIEKFMLQLERLDENHQAEIKQMELKHKQELEEARQQDEKFMLQLQRLDENHQSEIKQLEMKHERELEETQKDSSNNETNKLRLEEYVEKLNEMETLLLQKEEENKKSENTIFNLRREVEKVEFKCAKFEEQIGNHVQSSEDETMKLSQEIEALKEELEQGEQAREELEAELSASQEEAAAAQEQYTTLKTRVKAVATELKERRAECREFNEIVSNLESQMAALNSEKTQILSELTEARSDLEEKENINQELSTELSKIRSELNALKLKKQKEEQKGDSALKTYKVKAQNALASANSRAAAANQAREEMMIECQGAKQAALDAENKAKAALLEKTEAEKKAKEEILAMEREVEDCYLKISEMEKKVEETEEKALEMEADIKTSTKEQHKIFDEMERMEVEIEKEKQSNSELHTKHIEEKQRAEQLMQEVLELREVQKRTSTEAFMAKKKEQEDKQTEDHLDRAMTRPPNSSTTGARNSEAEGTIALLQDELMGANEAIVELKEALRTLSEKQSLPAIGVDFVDSTDSDDDEDIGGLSQNPSGDLSCAHSLASGATIDEIRNVSKPANANTDTPLFYALEKQAELHIAKDEINRLANILGDAEAARMEALEERDAMKKRMEEAEARVRRQEKFINPPNKKEGSEFLSDPASEGENVNLEYLKNVILQYLNATTVSQRKSLIPVVGAVLCLTQGEQREAVQALESSSGLQSVGTSLIEGLETSLFGLSGSSARRETVRREPSRRERRY